jgi:hypothetical protein
MVDSCEHGNEPSGSTGCCEILESLSDRWILTTNSALWSWLVGRLIRWLIGSDT